MFTTQEKIKFVLLRTLGNFLILYSLFGMANTFGPVIKQEIDYRTTVARNIRFVVGDEASAQDTTEPTPTTAPARTFFGGISGGDKVEVLRPVDPNFSILIPKIGANSRVIPNVDPSSQDAYLEALKYGVAHAQGTGFPGGRNNIYLFAHSTDSFWNVGRYNAIFYLLKELENGDEVDVFYSRIRHKYKVVEKKVVAPDDVGYLTESTPFEQLVLQTCWPPGTTFQRLLVIARPESDL